MKKVFMFVLAMALAMFATSAMAQSSTTGSIEGVVTDPNGAAIPRLLGTSDGRGFAEVLESRASGQPLGSGDPEGAR